mgnify:CR=1 FL=1
MDLRRRITSVLDEKGISATAASKRAGLSDTTLTKFLNGHTRTITVENLEKIADVLGVSLRHLMFGEPDTGNVTSLLDRMSKRDRARAMAILEAFTAETDTAHNGAA